jgi:protein SCO1/2
MTKPPRPPSRPSLGLALAGIALACLLFAAAGAFWWGNGRDEAAIGGPFALEDGNGHRVTDRDYRGKYMLVYFGYTFCPDVCPTTLNEVAGAMEQLGAKAGRVQPIFITVDPKRDTPAVVKQYVAAFSPKLVGLTGNEAAVTAVAQEYRVYVATRRTGEGPNDYTVDHSSILYLMGPDGAFVAPIRADEPADQMAQDIAKFVS